MKPYFSILALISAATASCGNVLAEAIEGYPVIIYDTSDSPAALGADLNDVIDYINGADGDTAELYEDIVITSTLSITKDTFINIVSDGNEDRTITGENSRGLISFSATTLTLNCKNIIFSGSLSKDGAIHGNVNLSGNASFNANNTVDTEKGGGAIYGDVCILKNSFYDFSKNTNTKSSGGAVCGKVVVQENSCLFLSDNRAEKGGAIFGVVQIGKKSTATFSGNASSSYTTSTSSSSYSYGGAICGDVQGRGAIITFSRNTCSSEYRPYSSSNSNYYPPSYYSSSSFGGAVFGDVQVGEASTVTFSGNTCSSYSYYSSHSYGGAVDGDVQVGEASTVTFSGNTSTSTSSPHYSSSSSSYSYGGAIRGYVQVEEGSTVAFLGNTSSSSAPIDYLCNSLGGAVYGKVSLAGNITFENNSTLENGAVSGKGGAIYVEGSFEATDSTGKIIFSQNKSGFGGAIYCDRANCVTSSSVSNILFSKNHATTSGGGLYLACGNTNISFSGVLEFDGNSASSFGGAIYAGSHYADPLTISFNSSSRNTFSENSAGIGGAIASINVCTFYAGSETLFVENSAMGSGGAIYTSGIDNFWGNTKFKSNTADSGGAVYVATSGTANFERGSVVEFAKNSAATLGGAIYVEGSTNFTSGSLVLFMQDSAASGGAIYSECALTFARGSVVVFSENSATNGNGGAICSAGVVDFSGESEFTGNTVVYNLVDGTATTTTGGAISASTGISFASTSKATFSGNSIAATEKIDIRGGAIYSKSVSLDGDLIFENNAISAVGSTSINSGGGAIYADGAVTFSAGTTARFSGNTITSKATQSFGGGAIFADTVSLAGNVEFTSNTVTNSTISTMFSSGGAIFAFSGLEFSDGTTAVFTGNSAAYGGAINSYKGHLTFTEKTKAVFSGNSAARGGAIYVDAGTFTLAGDVQFLNNTASAQGGAIRLGETTLVCEGDTTKVVFSGNKVGSDAKGWTNNDILLVKAISSMTIRDAGTYEFGGGIDASAGGMLSISDANVTFQSGSITKLGGVTTISGGANVTIGVGTTFDLVSGATFSIEDYSVLTLHTNLSEATVITVAAGASVAFEETSKLIIDISMAAAASAMLAESDGRTLVDDVAKIAIIRADDEAGIGDLGNVELLVNGATFNGEWNTLQEGNTFYLTVTIPEPSAFGLLAGLGALALVGTRRRRK